MNFNEYFKLALISILSHKMRAFLTMLGIIIGIASLFIIITIGKGGEHVLKSQIAGTSNSIDVYYQPSEEELSENPSSILKDAFSEEDIDNLNRVTGVKDVVANNSISTNIRYKDNEITASTLGATDEYFKVNEVKVIEGRGFSITDFLGGQPVAIINQELLEEVFKYDNVLEEVIWVGDYPIKVIGVTESEDGVINSNPTLYLPWNSFKNTFSIKNFNQLTVTVQDAEYITMIGKEILEILNNSNNTENSYQVVNFEEVTTLIEQITTTLTLIVGSIAGISIVVGGVGVMNIMLVSVTERTREIGIRKALGATENQIVLQFLIESVAITLLGGLIGMILGIIGSAVLCFLMSWPLVLSWNIILIGVAFSMLVGIIFGIIPAKRASSMQPTEALKYE